MAVLEPELNALAVCLKNAVVKTGQIYNFHADTQRLGIRKYAPYPPRNLTASLGRELEKYDQICDTIETHLLHAISVLKRDLAREESRAREAEMAAMAAQSTMKSPASNRAPLPFDGDASMQPPPTPVQGSPQGPMVPARRQSAISLSSLHRPHVPLKLDLSSSSFRMTAEEALFPKGLVPSPVSLAPKSARPSSTADIDLMAVLASTAAANASAQHVDIDLTVDETSPAMMAGINTTLGNSADKPIELDLDSIDMEMSNMTDLFGDGPESASGDGLFTPTTTDAGTSLAAGGGSHKDTKPNNHISMEILDALTAQGNNHDANLFGPSSSGEQVNNNIHGPPGGHVTSPASLLASFANQPQLDPAGEHMHAPFDLSTIDFSNLGIFGGQNSDGGLMDMEALLSMHHTTDQARPNS
ncbi:hypothetical protein V8B97DRAFT_2009063 [Scleroderma yunnanense]